MSTAALVPVFMSCTDGVNFLPAGFGREVIDRLQALAARRNFDSGLAINAEHLKRVYDDLLAESNVEPLYYTRLVDAVVESGRIEAILCNAPSGNFAVKAPIYLDATGDGTFAVLAGAPYEFGGENGDVMPSTLCSLWAGIDFAAYRAGGAFSHNDDNMLAKLEEAFRDGRLSVPDFHHTGIFRVSNVAAVGNITHVFGVDSTDERSLTRGVIENRRLLAEYEEFYRSRIAGFGNAEIVGSGSVLGVRESRRILGDYVLCSDDYVARRDFPDEIGRYNFPADIHPARPGKEEVIAHKRLFSLLPLRERRELRHSLPDPAAARREKSAHLWPLRELRPQRDGVDPGDPRLFHHRAGGGNGGGARGRRREVAARGECLRTSCRTSRNRSILSLTESIPSLSAGP
ncbi:MAG: FAD-dependent oxidoreductase [Lentisphaeria bacterium]|nr:MAG: FAD-dependent oxidoreductase [Lentisphaeria bacterium]